MPVALSYPGVYIEEIPSGQFTITGVATSITAFVGRARFGPIDEPVTLFSFGDYERMFGGLAYDYPLSYAVQDFFMNGGGQAIVARLFESSGGPSAAAWTAAAPATLKLITDALTATTPAPTDTASFNAACSAAAATVTGTPNTLIAQDICDNLQKSAPSGSAPFAADAVSKLIAGATAPAYPAGLATVSLDSTGGAAIARPAQAVASAAVVALLNSGPAPSAPALKAGDGRAPVQLDPPVSPAGPVAPVDPDHAPDSTPGTTTAAVAAAPLAAAPATPVADPSLALVQSAANSAALQSPDVQSARIARAVAQAAAGATGIAAAQASLAKVSATLATASLAGSDTLKAVQDVLSQQLATLYATPPAASAGASAAVTGAGTLATALNALAGANKAAGAQVADAVTTAAKADGATMATVFAAALDAAVTASFTVPAAQVLTLQAANPGSWGNQLSVALDRNNINDHTAKRYQAEQLVASDLFNIDVTFTRDNGSIDMERFTNVTINTKLVGNKPLANRLDLVLAAGSRYARVPLGADGKTPVLPTVAPVSGTGTASGAASGGDDGQALSTDSYVGDEDQKTGLYMLKKTDLFNLLCIPPDVRGVGNDTDPSVYQEALALCVARRAMLIVDPPSDWTNKYHLGKVDDIDPTSLYLTGEQSRNAAVYFPRIVKEDVLMDGQLDVFPACGAIAGVIAATDVQRGVWKAPAGQNAGLANMRTLEVSLSDQEQGLLNPLGINCLRNLSVIGPVVWGARTLRGADMLSDDYKYLSVRRLALFLEESLYRGTRWAVFEPNNEALWSALRLSINAFMGDLARQGAFYGFKIKCDADTNPQTNIDLGIVTVLVQYAPVKPAEFVVLQFQQQAGISPV